MSVNNDRPTLGICLQEHGSWQTDIAKLGLMT